MIVSITVFRGSFVFSQSCVVSASLINVGSLAVGAFHFVNSSLSVVGFVPVLNVAQQLKCRNVVVDLWAIRICEPARDWSFKMTDLNDQ